MRHSPDQEIRLISTANQKCEYENFVIFETESGKVNVDVFYQDKTLWLTQKTIAELDEKEVCRDFRNTAEIMLTTTHQKCYETLQFQQLRYDRSVKQFIVAYYRK